jgi:polysaccharide export outer membrane protein
MNDYLFEAIGFLGKRTMTGRVRAMIVLAALLASSMLVYAVPAHAAEPTAATPAATPAASPVAAPGAYRIQAGDLLIISVWKEPDLQSEVQVRSDGALSFPLTGDIAAAGMTVEELRSEIAKRLGEYVPDAVVTVALKLSGGNRIYVLGKVNRPGEFPFGKPIDVMQAISLAGGLSPFASPDDMHILRRGANGSLQSIPFRYSDVERGRALAQNILLQGGDTVVVP